MVAIIVTVVLMMVISLITIAFAQITRRQQRDTLDRQLSSQAFYAAESGINLAKKIATDELASPAQTVTPKTDCADTGAYAGKYTLSSSPDIKITCLLVTNSLKFLKYPNVSMHAAAANLKPESAIDTIGVSWQSSSTSDPSGCTGTAELEKVIDRSCKQPVIRVDLVPLATPDAAHTMTAFLSPGGSSALGFSPGVKGVVGIGCSGPADPELKQCTANISVPDGKYAIRIMSIYGNSDVVLFATQGGTYKKLNDGQIVIDSTAKSIDILRRVQVRFTPKQKVDTADFALTATDGICKRFAVQASGATAVLPSGVTSPSICDLP